MEITNAYMALLKVAYENGISLNMVITEIESAIKNAVDRAKKEQNQEALKIWKQIPSVGEYPTAVELIMYIGGKIS